GRVVARRIGRRQHRGRDGRRLQPARAGAPTPTMGPLDPHGASEIRRPASTASTVARTAAAPSGSPGHDAIEQSRRASTFSSPIWVPLYIHFQVSPAIRVGIAQGTKKTPYTSARPG